MENIGPKSASDDSAKNSIWSNSNPRQSDEVDHKQSTAILAMIIHSYIMSHPDEAPVLADAITSLAYFSDKIYLVDGGLGGGTICYQPKHTKSLFEWLNTDTDAMVSAKYLWFLWNGVPLVLFDHGFVSPADQRNWILEHMAQDSEQPDWIVWIDSDEVCSNEFILDIRPYLESLDTNVTNICPKWLTLIGNEQHCYPEYSSWLAHARIHRPGSVKWEGTWHENMVYTGYREQWDRYIVHTRMLFRVRLYLQRGHARLNEGVWSDVHTAPIPAGVTWTMTWPKTEPRNAPFDISIANLDGGKWAR